MPESNPDCPICLSEDTEEINGHPDAPDMDSQTIYKCSKCGTVWAEGYIIIVHGEKAQ